MLTKKRSTISYQCNRHWLFNFKTAHKTHFLTIRNLFFHYRIFMFKERNKAGQPDCVPLQPRPQEQEHNAQFYRVHECTTHTNISGSA